MMHCPCGSYLLFLAMKINGSEEPTTLQQKSAFVYKIDNYSKEATPNTNKNPTKWLCEESKAGTVGL